MLNRPHTSHCHRSCHGHHHSIPLRFHIHGRELGLGIPSTCSTICIPSTHHHFVHEFWLFQLCCINMYQSILNDNAFQCSTNPYGYSDQSFIKLTQYFAMAIDQHKLLLYIFVNFIEFKVALLPIPTQFRFQMPIIVVHIRPISATCFPLPLLEMFMFIFHQIIP